MAITKNPIAADAQAPYTVTRAMFWGGEVVPVGAVVQLTKAEAAPLLAAIKVAPGAPDAPDAPEAPEADKPKGKASKAADKAPKAATAPADPTQEATP